VSRERPDGPGGAVGAVKVSVSGFTVRRARADPDNNDLEKPMSKMKLFALTLVAGGYLLALGLNCLPNIGIQSPLRTLFGT
jgi:hypothetical protein